MDCDVRDLGLAPKGRERIAWAGAEMRVLQLIREKVKELVKKLAETKAYKRLV